jgi:hypothetical protein
MWRTVREHMIKFPNSCHPERSEGPHTRLGQHGVRKEFLPLLCVSLTEYQ